MSKAIRWQSIDGEGMEHLVFSDRPMGLVAEGAILSGGEAHFAAHYRIECFPDGHVARAEATIVGGPSISLKSDGRGKWWTGDGKHMPAIAGAFDVDFSATPFTNTLPIRRLGLQAGEGVELVIAYVRFPDLEISVDRQRYICVEPSRRYRYEAIDGDFRAEIEVDEAGLVTSYPPLFRRIL